MQQQKKKGDIVWARLHSPHQWWPALVLHSNNLQLSLSFFNLKTNTSSYFLQSQVLPFEQNFRTLINLHNDANNNDDDYKCDVTFYALLDSALRLLGQRVISSLRCRCCQMGFERKGFEFDDEFSNPGSYCFDFYPNGVLGFVLKGSVFPWVDAPDFVDAVRVVAQVHAFRSYCCVQQKRVYKETTKTDKGDDVKLHPCSSLGQKMPVVTQESVALEPKDNYHIISKKGEKYLAIGAIRKRTRLDEPVLCDCSLARKRILPFSSMNEVLASLQIIKSRKNELEESIQKDKWAGMCFSKTTINFTDGVQKVDLRKCQNLTLQQSFACDSLSNLVLGFHSDNYEADASAVKMNSLLGCNSSVYHKRLQISSNDDAAPLESIKSARAKLSSENCLVEDKDRYQCVASCTIFNSKVGPQSRTHVPVSSTSLFMKFPKTFNLPSKGVLIKKFSVFGSVDSSKTRVFSDTVSAQVAFFHEADAVAAHLYAKNKKVPFGEANVRFWLDPIVQKRRGFKRFAFMSPSARKPIGPLLKSCLKKPNSLRQEDRKKHYKVRFTVET